MDSKALEAVIGRQRKSTQFCVPLGVKKWFEDAGVESSQLHEMDWWQATSLKPSQLGKEGESDQYGEVKVTCVPAQHTSARKGIDKNSTLWAGFVIEQTARGGSPAPRRTCVYFAG